MTTLRRVLGGEPLVQEGLAHLLIDSVCGVASVGFLAPLKHETARAYWDDVFSALGPGLALWIVECDGQVVGSVQLALCQKENGSHRAEVQKLFVHSAFRGRGIASQLMAAAEGFARSEGRSLLVLDTQAGSHAEAVYQHLGWSRLGEIPNYAKSPDGTLHPTAYYFKAIELSSEVETGDWRELSLEPATPEDIETLAQVHDDAFASDTSLYGQGPPGYQKPDWHQAMFANNTYYKLRLGPQIVGGIIVIAQDPGQYLLNTLFVHPDFHGQGVGQQALALMEQAYPQAERWTLFTPYRSFRNQRFYEKQGFVKIGEEYITDQPGLVEGFHLFIYEKRREAPATSAGMETA